MYIDDLANWRSALLCGLPTLTSQDPLPKRYVVDVEEDVFDSKT